MTSASFDFAPLLPAGLPVPAARWTGLAKYSFVGGNNDPEQVPLDGLIDAVNAVLDIPAADIEPAPRFGAVKADLLHGIGKVSGRFVLLLNVQHLVLTLHLQEFVAHIP